jgi:hypothetical protein
MSRAKLKTQPEVGADAIVRYLDRQDRAVHSIQPFIPKPSKKSPLVNE